MNETTAILLFGRTASAEGRCKYFGSATDSRRAASALTARTLHTLRRTGLPVLHIDERHQRGSHFGERLANAVAEGFRAYERLIVVGNDCPELRVAHIRRADYLLSTGASVLGPDHRGGVWLLGLCRAQFCRDRLRAVRWNGEFVFRDLLSDLADSVCLTRLADVNAVGDLRSHWHRWSALLPDLAFLWAPASRPVVRSVIRSDARYSGPDSGRAPPRAA